MMRTYGYRRTLAEANEAANRRPENRLIYAQQQVDWFYTDLLKAQRGTHTATDLLSGLYWSRMADKAVRDLSEAHEWLLKVCAGLGPAKVYTRRDIGDYAYELRDVAGYIRSTDRGYVTRMGAAMHGHQAAINLGLEVE